MAFTMSAAIGHLADEKYFVVAVNRWPIGFRACS
jgi:hypothetical protein